MHPLYTGCRTEVQALSCVALPPVLTNKHVAQHASTLASGGECGYF